MAIMDMGAKKSGSLPVSRPRKPRGATPNTWTSWLFIRMRLFRTRVSAPRWAAQ